MDYNINIYYNYKTFLFNNSYITFSIFIDVLSVTGFLFKFLNFDFDFSYDFLYFSKFYIILNINNNNSMFINPKNLPK